MDLTAFVIAIVQIANGRVIPFLIAIALLVFIYNAIRYFVVEGGSQEGRDKARALATYSVLAFVFILIFWGLINIVTGSLGLERLVYNTPLCSDYDPNCISGARTRANTDADAFSALESQADEALQRALEEQAAARAAERAAANADADALTALETQADEALAAAERAARDAEADAFAAIENDADAARIAAEEERAALTAAQAVASIERAAEAYTNAAERGALSTDAAPYIADAVAAANDPNATAEEQAIAAFRLEQWGVLGSGDAGERLLAQYLDALEISDDARITLRSESQTLPERAIGNESELFRDMEAVFADTHSRFLRGEAREQELAQADVAIVRNETDIARLQAFDEVLAQNNNAGAFEPELAEIRARLVRQINVERFFASEPPIE